MKFKLVFNKEIHLVKLEKPTLQALQAHVQRVYPSINSNYKLTYLDNENDEISLTCQEDLQVLIDEAHQTVKLYIVVPQQQKMIHSHYKCDGCQTAPIVGTRFKCLECPNFDLCESCQFKNLHHNHKLFKISNPQELEDYQKTYCQKPKPCTQNEVRHVGPFPHIFNNFIQFVEDPKFKELKKTAAQVTQEFFKTMKDGINNQKVQQEEKSNEQQQIETLITDSQVPEKSQVQENENQIQKEEIKSEIIEQFLIQEPVESEIDKKVKQLAQIVDCSEQLAKEYVELFSEMPLEDIVDIIYNQK
ncbi:unnamed protein product [Paramecium sonneborni]|uniref:ZZ-type domain-containing protein n=1 Tax=Paramecium sonneborni TaxID=65129 RepID=A0A8S1QDS8_9CILI|nr:unnamed protein product [Paramecium sonneborni]